MFLTEEYKNRLKALAGIKSEKNLSILKEIEDLYANSDKRVKFDKNIMKQAIEGGLEIGMVFQSNNTKYKMPTWKYRIIEPVAIGYDKNGNLVVRGVHITGQSEKKAIQTGIRSAEAKKEWRLFNTSNIKSMFFTGNDFQAPSIPGYNPNDSAMVSIEASFEPSVAKAYQAKIKNINPKDIEPSSEPVEKISTNPSGNIVSKPNGKLGTKKDDTENIKKRIDKLNKFL